MNERAKELLAELLRSMSIEERGNLFRAMEAVVCRFCYDLQPAGDNLRWPRSCQCWNDE